MDDELSFGRWVKVRRVALGLTQAKLAARTGYSTVTIRKIESDDLRPSRQIAQKLAEVLAIAPDVVAANTFSKPRHLGDLPSTNLPRRLTSFIGREAAIATLRQLIPATRLVTLTGVGGVGKTSLALAVGSELLPNFVDGVWWVELAPLAEANFVLHAVAAIFKLHEQRDYLEALTTYCQGRQLLLILDNCEHVVDACAEMVEHLLRGCPRLHILTTSREPLRVDAEVEWQVMPLSVPQRDAEPDSLTGENALHTYEAVHLFVERARAKNPDFDISRQTAENVIRICVQLDGLPLAIELAASRLKGMTVGELALRLDDRFHLLTDGNRTALPRHQTLRATVDWSYALLSEAERVLLRRLSVFAGGWPLAAAEAIAGGQPDVTASIHRTLGVLLQLVNKSLVVAETRGDVTRYQMLETIRQFAAEKLHETDEVDAVRARHFTHFLALAEQSTDIAFVGHRLAAWSDQIDTELDNLRAAFAWSRQQADAELCLRLAGALWLFWHRRGRFREGQAWLEEALAHGGVSSPEARASALCGLSQLTFGISAERRALLAKEALHLCQQVEDQLGMAHCYFVLGQVAADQLDLVRAVDCYQQGLELYREVKWTLGIGFCMAYLADAQAQAGYMAQAIALYEESLILGREIDERWFLEHSLGCLVRLDPARGTALYKQELTRQRQLDDPETLAVVLAAFGGQLLNSDTLDVNGTTLDESIDALRESLSLWRGLGIKWSWAGGIARACMVLGYAYHVKREYELALEYGQEAIQVYQEVGDLHGVAWTQMTLGWPQLALGKLELAKASFRASLKPFSYGSMNCVPYALAGLAEIALHQGDLVHSGRLFGAASRYEQGIGPEHLPVKIHPFIQAAHTYLDNPVFAAAWAAGEVMPLAEVIAYALE